MTDLSSPHAWVRREDAPSLPPPRNTTGVTGWMLQNLFSSPSNAVLSVVGGALVLWLAWGILDWAILRAVFTGVDREACVATPHSGACWPYVSARFHQFIYGFYPFDQRWRVNICLVVGAIALATMAIPSVPHKKWNAIFLLVIYPLLTFILLTGGNLSLSLATILGFVALLLLSAVAVPIFAFGVEDGIRRNKLALLLAAVALAIFLASLVISMPTINVFGNFVPISTLLIVALLVVAAVLSTA